MANVYFNTRKKQTATEHHSFWLRPDTMRYIRETSQFTRIPQGQILQLIVDFFRLTRKQQIAQLTEAEELTLKEIYVFLRIFPL